MTFQRISTGFVRLSPRAVMAGLAVGALTVCAWAHAQRPAPHTVKEVFSPSHTALVIVAHRGCHEAAPQHGYDDAPENSLLALQRCVAMDVDMMEVDIHMAADGNLVVMHDDDVDRTTNGHDKVDNLTLTELRALRLRRDLGGYAAPITDQRVLTLNELLDAARGHITLNLDVKGSIYAEVVHAVLEAGAADFVTVKTRAGIASPNLSTIEPFTHIPFMPILDSRGSSLAAVAKRQLHEGSVLAVELPRMSAADLAPVVEIARQYKVKLLMNTLGDGFLQGRPGDNDVLRDPDAVWGYLYRAGVTVIQTDHVEQLAHFRLGLSEEPLGKPSMQNAAPINEMPHSEIR